MKALTLSQPFAHLVTIGAKRWETRSVKWKHRGELAIHSSANIPKRFLELCDQWPFSKYIKIAIFSTGFITALVDVEDCIESESALDLIRQPHAQREVVWRRKEEEAFGDYSPGRFVYRLENLRRLAYPVKCKGALGLWSVPPTVEAKVREALV